MSSSITPSSSSLSAAAANQNNNDKEAHPSAAATTNRKQKQVTAAQDLYRRTPLIRSDVLSEMVGGMMPVYLKLDALQNSGSFKDRGMAFLCWELQRLHGVSKIMSSSGGNAGLAAATVARQLDNMECTVVVPKTTKPLVIDKLKALGATVQIVGENWNQADAYVRNVVANDTSLAYIPPYEHPLLWTGHSTVIDEIYDSMEEPPGTIIVSVGGGGLLCGVLEGLERLNKHCNVIAAETVGAASFGQAWQSRKQQPVTLPAIESVATSLGALQVSPTCLERAKNHEAKGLGTVQSVTCTDAEAIDACLQVRTYYMWNM